MELKTVLRKIVREKGITIVGLSRAINVPVQTLHGWLQGIEPKSIRQLKIIADYLDVDLDYLCFGDSPELKRKDGIENFEDEINAGIFEVVLRKVRKK